jgi:glycosyltransferase involved in cell wall biosynthesis
MPGFHDDHLPYLKKMVRELVRDGDEYVVWFTTPMALPLLQELPASLVVYDCMDELAAFKNPPRRLLQRENSLLKRADIVFTGGPSLYHAKKDRHPNVHCFPCSVDVQHFAQALDRANAHPAHRGIAGPRLGFYGVIDERFDTELVGRLAQAHPQWQIVLAGPVVKIDPATLPRHDNIHYLGQQPYEALPRLLAGWDVCLLPFAMNESTRFISPTRSLEYMAAELPIVSTPVRDVVDLHSDVVTIAGTPEEFIAACEAALLSSPDERLQKVRQMRDKLTRTSWDATALAMRDLMEATEQSVRDRTPASASAAVAAAGRVSQLYGRPPARSYSAAIIGAGPAGLSAASRPDQG